MTTKDEVKRMLSKGLTGKEAGRLILQDSWLVDRGKDGFLSDKDISAIRASLRSTKDKEDYNSYISAYRLIDFTLKEAHILALEIQRDLLLAVSDIKKYLLDDRIKTMEIFEIPAIVTQKQYDKLSKKQRDLKLKEIHDLREILESRADLTAPEAVKQEHSDQDYLYLTDYLRDEHPDLYKQTVSEILELVRSGRLKADLARPLEILLEGSASEEEQDKLLEEKVCSGEDLYKAGLPEWIEWIDVYKPDLDEETMARPKGMMQSMKVAILQDPQPEDLDERGYYKDPNSLVKLSDLVRLKNKSKEEGGRDPADLLQRTAKNITGRLAVFMAYQAVIEAVSEVIGVDFTEDMKEWHSLTLLFINTYNVHIEISHHADMPKLEQINTDNLRPSKKTVSYIQERMAMSLGEGWQIAKEALSKELLEKEAQYGQG